MFNLPFHRIAAIIGKTRLGLWPVRVRSGLAKGARWTALPSSAYWRGTFERDVDAAVLRSGIGLGDCCWDLGTHFGLYTVGMAMKVGPTGQVVGFEPDPYSFRRCARHIAMNNLTWVRIYEGAASDRTGQSELLIYNGFGNTSTHLAFSGESGVGASRHPIKTFAIDDLVERGEIRAPRLVKIDVEGHGAAALNGMAKTIVTARPHVIMSVHCPEEAGATFDLFGSSGYSCRDCLTGEPLRWPAADWFGSAHLVPNDGGI